MPAERPFEVAVPLVEETVRVGKREVESGGVRVSVSVETREVPVEQVLERRTAEVTRRAVGHPVDQVPQPRQEGDVLVIPVVEEEVVVTKRLILKEEILIRTVVDRRTEQGVVTVRSERAEVTRLEPPPSAVATEGVRND
ncbi:MAG TPA: DUF2382 domain-containing protein [Azospirillaceae bacterium]|nr:DUF2382 domain-containing protein [Azospirillaceae bacterium]